MTDGRGVGMGMDRARAFFPEEAMALIQPRGSSLSSLGVLGWLGLAEVVSMGSQQAPGTWLVFMRWG